MHFYSPGDPGIRRTTVLFSVVEDESNVPMFDLSLRLHRMETGLICMYVCTEFVGLTAMSLCSNGI